MRRKKLLGIPIAYVLLASVAALALTGSFIVVAQSRLEIPNQITFGNVVVGQSVEQPVFAVLNTSTGANLNFSVENITGPSASYLLRSPGGRIFEITPGENTQVELDIAGNWTLKISPKGVGQIEGLFRIGADNETLFNVTRI